MNPIHRAAQLILLTTLAISDASQADGTSNSTVVGTLRLHQLDSGSLKTTRTIRVWLPPGYDAGSNRRHPVLYLHDGQNCFDRATSAFGKEWQIDETLTRLIGEGKMPPLIVVAIDNGGAERINELTFTADPKHGGGKGEAYAAFLLDEVRPFIDRTYRTQTGPAATFIGGSSLGGLASLEIARRHPGVFGGVIAMSPSLWWAGQSLTQEIDRDPAGLKAVPIWIDVGTREEANRPADSPENRLHVAHVRQLDDVLTRHHRSHHLLIGEGDEHSETAWARRFPEAIQYLLRPEKE